MKLHDLSDGFTPFRDKFFAQIHHKRANEKARDFCFHGLSPRSLRLCANGAFVFDHPPVSHGMPKPVPPNQCLFQSEL